MGEFQKRIKEKGKKLPMGRPYLVNATKYKAGLMIIDVEDLYRTVDEARKEFPWDVLCNVGHPMFQPDEARLRKWFKKYFLGT